MRLLDPQQLDRTASRGFGQADAARGAVVDQGGLVHFGGEQVNAGLGVHLQLVALKRFRLQVVFE